MNKTLRFFAGLAAAALLLSACSSTKDKGAGAVQLLNVSYDPTRELYEDVNRAFTASYKAKTGTEVSIRQSHGGSGKQARSVIDGLEADVVTLALAYDVDAIAGAGLLDASWSAKLPERSTPYTSTIVLLVRTGNPRQIKDWDDLARDGVGVITPNPKTSGGARWNYLAAWGFEARRSPGDAAKPADLVRRIFKNVVVLDSGGRGSTTTFIERGIGDVFIAWENEALLVTNKLAPGKFEIVYPSATILAEPPVAVIDKVVDRRGTRAAATAYLEFLYTDEGQKLVAKHFYRPRSAAALAANASLFPDAKMTLFTVDEQFGGWKKAHEEHFKDGGKFDQIYEAKQ